MAATRGRTFPLRSRQRFRPRQRPGLAIESVEIIVNGEVARTISAGNTVKGTNYVAIPFDPLVPIKESFRVAVRTFTKGKDGRPRFAHSAPVRIEIPDKPQHVRRVEVEHLVGQVRAEIECNKDVLPARALSEHKKALTFYESQLENAR